MRQAVDVSDWEAITRALIEVHYDPSYGRSMTGNFTGEMVGSVDVSDLDFDWPLMPAVPLLWVNFQLTLFCRTVLFVRSRRTDGTRV